MDFKRKYFYNETMKTRKIFFIITTAFLILSTPVFAGKKSNSESKKIEKSINKTKKDIKKDTKKIKKSAKKTGKDIKKTAKDVGEDISDAAKEAGNSIKKVFTED